MNYDPEPMDDQELARPEIRGGDQYEDFVYSDEDFDELPDD